jgi:hypothetical protein
MTANSTSTLKHLKEYWIVYAFAVQLVINYTITNQTIADHSKRLDMLEAKALVVESNLSEIKVQLSSIQTSLKFIEKQLK